MSYIRNRYQPALPESPIAISTMSASLMRKYSKSPANPFILGIPLGIQPARCFLVQVFALTEHYIFYLQNAFLL